MFARRLTRTAAASASRFGGARQMGSHAPPPTEGLDGMVRKYLPGDHHVAMGIIGFYGALYGLVKVCSGGKTEEVDTPVFVEAASSGAAPSIESPEFEAWVQVPGNLEKLFDA